MLRHAEAAGMQGFDGQERAQAQVPRLGWADGRDVMGDGSLT